MGGGREKKGRDRLRENAKKIVPMVSIPLKFTYVYVICNETRQSTDSEVIDLGTAV